MSSNRRQFLSKSAALASSALVACSTGAVGLAAKPDWPPQFPDDDDKFWEIVRRQFPLTTERTYFNTGGLGPAPYPVLDAMHKTIMDLQRVSETGHSKLDTARAHVADYFGADLDEIAFTRNATEGNATVASGLDLKRGDEVIFESHVHPGGAMAWMVRQREEGIRVRIFEPSAVSHEENLDRIRQLITPATKVIQVSHVTAPTGISMPVNEIAKMAKDAGAWFHIDGAQSAGMITFDLHEIGCDSYATSGHKWLGAPHGTGFLYIRKDRLSDVTPTEAGAYSSGAYDLPDVFDYNPTAQRFESGTRDASTVVGIQAAIEFHSLIGGQKIEDYSRGLARHLRKGLAAISGVTVLSPTSPELDSAMTTIKLDSMKYDDLYRFLIREHKFRCRVVTERKLDGLRISTHIFNSKSDCDRVIEAVRLASNS